MLPSFTLFTLFSFVLVSAQLAVTQPKADHWWVARSLNTLAWTGGSGAPTEFSVFLVNPDTSVLTDKLALISIEPLYEYSKDVNPGNITPHTGYTIQLTNTLNSSDVYATSETFEIKALGSAYPAQTTASSSSSISGNKSSSPSAYASASSGTSGSGPTGDAPRTVYSGITAVMLGCVVLLGAIGWC